VSLEPSGVRSTRTYWFEHRK